MLEIHDVFKGILILVCVFVPLEQIWTMHKQKIWRNGIVTDICYYFLGFFIGKGTTQLLIVVALLSQGSMPLITNFTAQLPLVVQVPVAILIADLSFYILHRLMHTVPWLWKFHAIHHSSAEIDWLSTVRVHPVEQILTKACQMIPLYWLGFSTQALAIYALFSSAIAFFIHANIQIRLPIIKWIIATPEFHHWHHASSPELSGKNLAVQLPIIDYVFGTFHLSSDKSPSAPSKYGVKLKTKTDYLHHLVYPFKDIFKKIKHSPS